MALRDAIYVGTDDARMLWLSQGGSVLAPIDGFDNVAGRDAWFAGSVIVNGQRLGPPLGIRSVAMNWNGSILFANVHVGGIPRGNVTSTVAETYDGLNNSGSPSRARLPYFS